MVAAEMKRSVHLKRQGDDIYSVVSSRHGFRRIRMMAEKASMWFAKVSAVRHVRTPTRSSGGLFAAKLLRSIGAFFFPPHSDLRDFAGRSPQ
jgi:hypothetical protein